MFKDVNLIDECLAELPPINFMQGKRKVIAPVRRTKLIASDAQGANGGAVYVVGDSSYFVGDQFSPATRKQVARLDYFLSAVKEIDPASPIPANKQTGKISVSPAILDDIEAFIVQHNNPQPGRAIFIHRDDAVYEITPTGLARVPDLKPAVA